MFDALLAAFVAALNAGFLTLHTFSLPLLVLVTNVAWLRSVWPSIRSGMPLGEIYAHALLMVVSIVVYLVLLLNLQYFTTLAFDAAAALGAAASGGQISGARLMQPSGVFEAGAAAATPIQEFLRRMTGWAALFNIHTILNYSIAYLVVIAAFIGIALNLSLTMIEFHFALLCATVLIPWAPLAGSAFVAEFAIAWLVGMIVRVFIQTAVIGMSLPLFEHLTLTTTAGGDPDFWGAIVLVGGSIFFFIMAWIIPNRATAIAGRGMALGIGGDAFLSGMQSAARGIRGFYSGGSTVVSGVSGMMKTERQRV